jgi:hypothetical protein
MIIPRHGRLGAVVDKNESPHLGGDKDAYESSSAGDGTTKPHSIIPAYFTLFLDPDCAVHAGGSGDLTVGLDGPTAAGLVLILGAEKRLTLMNGISHGVAPPCVQPHPTRPIPQATEWHCQGR